MATYYYLLISNKSLLDPVHWLATFEPDSTYDKIVDKKNQVLDQDKITVLFHCVLCFLQNLNTSAFLNKIASRGESIIVDTSTVSI